MQNGSKLQALPGTGAVQRQQAGSAGAATQRRAAKGRFSLQLNRQARAKKE